MTAGTLVEAVRIRDVHDHQDAVRRLQCVDDPRFDEIRRDRRQIDQLQVGVLERQHARHGLARGQRVGPDIRLRAGQARVQTRFARVRRPDQRDLGGTFGPDRVHGPRATTALARPGEFLGQVLDARLDVGLQVIGSLVLGNRAQHFLQARQALGRLARGPVRRLGLAIVRGQVRWHAGIIEQLRRTCTSVAERIVLQSNDRARRELRGQDNNEHGGHVRCGPR